MTNYSNIEAEQIIFGTAILNNAYLANVADILEEKHFFYNEHKLIWNQFIKIGQEGGIANPTTLRNFMNDTEGFNHLGGVKYLGVLLDQATGIVDIRHYAKLLIELWQKRELEILFIKGLDDLKDKNFDHISSEIENEMSGLAFQEAKKKTQHISEIISDIELEDEQGLSDKFTPTGFSKLDDIMSGGIYNKQLCIIGARPSVGKTSIAQDIILKASKQGKKCLFISLEVDKRNVLVKFLSNLGSVENWKIQKRVLNDMEKESLKDIKQEIKEMQIYVNDSSNLNIQQIDKIVKNQMEKQPVDLLVIDYVQIIKGIDTRGKNESVIIKESTTQLKTIAKKYDIGVLALAQINRKAVEGQSQEPTINDFKSSGGIEEDADVAIILHRDRNEGTEDGYFSNSGKLIIAKNRHGRTGSVNINFDGQFGRFNESNF